MSAIRLPLDERGWWICDGCGHGINPKWRTGTPTPEKPVGLPDGRTLWLHRECPEAPDDAR